MADPHVRKCPARAEAGPHDPFEAFNRAQGMGSVRNPHAEFAEQRARCPVQHIERSGSEMERAIMGTQEVYAALSHDAVSQVLRDGEHFTSTVLARSIGVVMGHTIIGMDEPEHSRYRGLIQKAFTRKALERWEHSLVRPIVNACIDAFADRGRADLVRELTFPFPVRVIAGMLGLPEGELDRFHRLAVELISIQVDPARGLQASRELAALFTPLVSERRAAPRDDLISVLATAELDGARLTDEEIVSFLRLLLPAGAETTYRSSSNLFFGLLTHPDQLDAVRRDHGLFDAAMEEGLRWEPPLLMVTRGTRAPVELAGVPLPASSGVRVMIGAANRDPERYEHPDAFDIFRKPKQHLAFGFGAHRCLGMHLARMETFVVLEAVLDRLPNLRLDPDAEDVHITGQTFRAPARLPVLFDTD